MKGPAILLLVSLAVLVDQAASNHILDRNNREPWRCLSSLLGILGEPMPGHPADGAQKVFDRLLETIDREKTVPRLKGYTVGQLVALNEWNTEDCEEDKLEERRSICKAFSTKELTELNEFARAPKRETQDGDLIASDNDQIDWNVGKYCWRVTKEIERLCPFERVQAYRMDGVTGKRLASFRKKIQSASKTPKEIFVYRPRRLALKKLEELRTKDPEGAAALKKDCSFILNELQKPGAYYEVDTSLAYDLNYCKILLELDEATQSDLDEAPSTATQFANDDQASG